jgi:putative transposase
MGAAGQLRPHRCVAPRRLSARPMESEHPGVEKRNVSGSILHSDQGFQYTSTKYSQFLEMNNMLGSHSRKGNCLDNACVESFFSHFKSELVDEYINFYNNERSQKRLNRCSPVKYRLTTAA